MQRRLFFLIYDGFELIDFAGPSSVFTGANRLSGRDLYRVQALSCAGGPIVSGAGVAMESIGFAQIEIGPLDTVLVMGADRREALRHGAAGATVEWLRGISGACERLGSVCTGATILARTGLLKGRRATTHWEARGAMAARYPDIMMQEDGLYAIDGPFWTSAGATAGIDMALAMIERDHGTVLKARIAKSLVVYAHRPGNQAQFSALLAAQTAVDGRFAALIDWLTARLAEPLTLEAMAAQAGMAERSFRRHFTACLGLSPVKFLENLRLDRAKTLLEAHHPVKSVAAAVGFRSEAHFRGSFSERFGLSPAMHMKMHGGI